MTRFVGRSPILPRACALPAVAQTPFGYTIVPSGQMACQNAAKAQNKAGAQSIRRRTYLSEKGRAFLLFNPSNFAEGIALPINGRQVCE